MDRAERANGVRRRTRVPPLAYEGPMMLEERAFYPGFLERLHDLELVKMQHELRQFPEDKLHLNQVLLELKRRAEVKKGRLHDG